MIRSKAFVSTEEMGEQYCLLGPYKENYARTAVEELEFEYGTPYHVAVTKMRDQGFKVRNKYIYGLYALSVSNVCAFVVVVRWLSRCT